jgi:hypothetical protein
MDNRKGQVDALIEVAVGILVFGLVLGLLGPAIMEFWSVHP